MSDEENTQPAPELTQPQPSPEATAGDAEPISNTPVENSGPVPVDSTSSGQVSPSDSAEATPDEAEAPPSPEEVVPLSDDAKALTDKNNDILAPPPPPPPPPPETTVVQVNKQKELWKNFLAKVAFGKRKKLDKILSLFIKKQNGSTSSPQVTNDEVEKLLHVSDATATRYLDILEKEGKIKQIGKTGRNVRYSKIP